MKKPLYKGIQFSNYPNNKSLILTDVELVKRNLINHIYTRKGERIKMGNYGTTIPDLVFEQMTENLIGEVRTQLESVFNYDPRVELINLRIVPLYDTNELVAMAELFYIELNLKDRLDIMLQFEG